MTIRPRLLYTLTGARGEAMEARLGICWLRLLATVAVLPGLHRPTVSEAVALGLRFTTTETAPGCIYSLHITIGPLDASVGVIWPDNARG